MASAASASTTNGTLLVPHGYVGALACDPIEKKPFFHVLPGSDALTFGMLGCDYHCGYCQNWVTSQMLRDADAVARAANDDAGAAGGPGGEARRAGGGVELQRAADHQRVGGGRVQRGPGRAGCGAPYISNGNGTPQVLDFIRPHVDAYKVDLKAFNDKSYRQLGGVLENVTGTIRMLKERGLLGRDRHAGRPRLQRRSGRPQAHGRVPRVGRPAHALAHDGVPPRLQDDRRVPQHDASRTSCRSSSSAGRRG